MKNGKCNFYSCQYVITQEDFLAAIKLFNEQGGKSAEPIGFNRQVFILYIVL